VTGSSFWLGLHTPDRLRPHLEPSSKADDRLQLLPDVKLWAASPTALRALSASGATGANRTHEAFAFSVAIGASPIAGRVTPRTAFPLHGSHHNLSHRSAVPAVGRTRMESVDGVITVDKPQGWTSHDVVNKLRRIAGTKKVGHLGTLDPMATGVLPLVVGRATRLAQFFTRNEKVYEGTIRFGFSTDSYDADGTQIGDAQPVSFSEADLQSWLDQFRGDLEQTPPPISAKKIGGKKAYELARANVVVELKPVSVRVFELTLLSFDGLDANVRIHSTAGMYVRSIAHDLGQLAGCGAHLAALRRTASGDFKIESARTLDDLAVLASEGRLSEALIPAAKLLPEFPAEMVDVITAGRIRQGRDFHVSPFRVRPGAKFVKAISHEGALVAIGEAKLPNIYHPVLVL
jgi:tRNA pseudouridine55 synthase